MHKPITGIKGVYHDTEKNELVFEVPQMLKHFGWVDTSENRGLITKMCTQLSAELFPKVPVTVDSENGK